MDEFAIPEDSCAGRGRRIGEKEFPYTIDSLDIVPGEGGHEIGWPEFIL